jgi:PPOX class probable FMN-dependent enzyme
MHEIATLEALETVYDQPVDERSRMKERAFIDANHKALIEAAPFCVLASVGPGGLDCSPRGDRGELVRVRDPRTLLLPDRRGNNRIDSLRNILEDPRVALLFLIPGIGETIRVNGRATISVDPDLLASFSVAGKPPRSVLVVSVDTVFFQCSRAVVRAALWEPDARRDREALPTAGQILQSIAADFDGAAYDAALGERVRATLY